MLAIVTSVIFWIMITGKQATGLPKPSLVSLGFLLMWLVSTVMSYSNSIILSEYANEVAKVTGYTGFFLVCMVYGKNGFKEILVVRFSTSVAIVLGLVAAIQFAVAKPEFNIYDLMVITGLMSNKNLFSEYLALLLPFVVLGAILEKGSWRLAHITGTVTCVVLILLLMARSSWLAISISLLVAFAVWLKQRGSGKALSKIMLLTSLGFVVIILVNWTTDYAILTRALSLFDYQSGSGGYRLLIWENTIKLIKENPITGVGAGYWQIAFQQFGLSRDLDTFTTQTLNDYLSIFSETGFFGFFGYAGFISTGIIYGFKSVMVKENRTSLFRIALTCSIIVFAIISFFNFPKNRPEHFLFLLFLVWQATSYAEFDVIELKMSLLYSLLLPLLIASCYLTYQRIEAEQHLKQALGHRMNYDWNSVISEIKSIDTRFYGLEPTTTPVAWYQGVAHFELKDYEPAFESFKEAYRFNPYHVHVLNNLATSHEIRGGHSEAISLYEKALELNPYFTDALLNLVAVYYNQGNYDQALNLIDESKLNHLNSVKNYRKIVLRQMSKPSDIRK